jgi:hypothetical protein
MAGKTLVVVPGQDDFVFYFEDTDDRYWRVRDYPGVPGWFLVEEYQNGWYAGEFYDKYENAGASDLQDLLKRLLAEPETTLEGLFAEKIEVDAVIVVNEITVKE